MATVAGRRRSSGGGSTTSAGTTTDMAPTATSSSGHGKRPSVSSTKSGGSGSRNRIDPSLMMSTKATDKSSDEVRNLSRAGGSRHNKSSDRLSRMGGGASSTTLTSNKRSKSYSQIMSAGAASNAGGSGKKKKEVVQDADDDEDEDGWMSSSQRGTPVESGSPQSGSDDGDEGLVMNAKEKPSTKQNKSNAEGGSTPRGRNHDTVKAGEEKTPLKRNDTQVTLRGFDARQGEDREQREDSVAFPADDEAEEESTAKQTIGKQSSQILKESAANHTASTSGTGAQDSIAFPSSPGKRMPSLQREPSTMSGRTLTPSEHGQETSSPTSVKSRSSLRSLRSRTSLYPRESQGPAAPKLSTHYALAGALGSLQEESELERAMSQQVKRLRPGGAGMPSSKSEASHLHQRYHFDAGDSNFQTGESSRRKSSISSIQTNTIKLPTTSPSLGDVSHDAIRAEQVHQRSGSSAFDVMQRVSGFHTNANNGRTEYDRRRTTSTKSLTAADAASLAAKLRLARGDSFEDAQTSASKMLASSSSKYFATVSRSDAASTKALKEYNKPTISVFVKRLGERKNIEVKVPRGGLFDDDFTRASVGDQGGTGGAKRKGDDDDDDVDGDMDSEDAPTVRYVMDFGLSGPAVQKTATAEALLGTLLDHDEFEATWAPALANAAGLGEGTRRAREAARTGGALDSMQFNGLTSTGGVAINGPNATPMHFLHGLTNTTDAPFPLEPSDMATSANQHLHGGSNDALEGSGEYLDAKNLRAIAMTWTALNVNKSHIVTRRYVDPMRESLERIGRANGTLAGKGGTGMAGSTTSPHPGHSTPGSGATTPGGSLRWGAWRNLFSEHQQQQQHQPQASE